MTASDTPENLKRQAADIQAQWYIPDSPDLPRGWLVYSLDFILATLQGYFTEPQNISHAIGWLILGRIVQGFMAVAQAILMLLAWLPITSTLLEIVARTFTRSAVGFFLRACYWKAKLRHLGQDTVIDQNVEIWGPANVSIGSRCHIDTSVRLAAGERRHRQHGFIRIGNFVHLGPGVHIAGRGGVFIRDFVGIMANAHLYSATGVIERPADPGQLISMSHMAPHDQQHIIEAPIVVEDYAFLGMATRVMPGVRVGRGAVIHANCELSRDVPPFANIGGMPRGRQIGWRKPRRRSAHWNELSAKSLAQIDMPVIVEVANPRDEELLDEVLDLHFEAFREGVTTQLGPAFVRRYYRAMIKVPSATLWVVRLNGRVCGFMGCTSNRQEFERAQRSGATWVLAFWRLMTFRLSPTAALRVLRKRRLSHSYTDRAELLSIVVSPAERRLGLGKKFLDLWMETLRAANAPGYIVFTDNLEGIRFYEKYKGDCLFKFELKGLWSACYRFSVAPADAEPTAQEVTVGAAT